MLELTLESLESTQKLASTICSVADKPLTVALNGTLGTGKTQFVRFFVQALFESMQVKQSAEVTSPTYVLLQRYPTKPTTYHFDFYRLENQEQVWDLGIDEIYESQAWVLIEWAEKFPQCLPDDYLEIRLEHTEQDKRLANLNPCGGISSDLFSKLASAFGS